VPAAADREREVKAGVGGERVRVGELFYASRDQFETFDRRPTNGWDELDHLGQNGLRSISSSAYHFSFSFSFYYIIFWGVILLTHKTNNFVYKNYGSYSIFV
jgi:hypothetical protein